MRFTADWRILGGVISSGGGGVFLSSSSSIASLTTGRGLSPPVKYGFFATKSANEFDWGPRSRSGDSLLFLEESLYLMMAP